MLGLGRSHPTDLQARLPRGQCRFILLHPEVSGQRCSCQGFWLNNAVPGSSCACGHQACYHVSEASHEAVSRQEHEALLLRVARLEANLKGERTDDLRRRVGSLEEAVEQGHHVAEEGYRGIHRAIQGVYGHMSQLRRLAVDRFVQQDDKIEGLLDEITSLRERVVAIDEITMDLEDRLSELGENEGSGTKGHPSPRQVEPPMTGVEVPTGETSTSWTANVAFVPSLTTDLSMVPFHEGTKAYRRCASRGLTLKVTFNDLSSSTFQRMTEEEFGQLLAGRRWMPLACIKSDSISASQSDQKLDRLPEDLCREDLWDASFLQQHCICSTKASDVPLLHITFREDVWTWKDMHGLPAVGGKEDDPCWQHDESLDEKQSNDKTTEALFAGSELSTRKGRSTSLSMNPCPPKKLKKRTSSDTFEVPRVHIENESIKRIRVCVDQPVRQVGRFGVGSCTTAVI